MLGLVGTIQDKAGPRAGMAVLGDPGNRPANGNELGTDFARLLQAAQDTSKEDASHPRPESVEKAGGEPQAAEVGKGDDEVDAEDVEKPRAEKTGEEVGDTENAAEEEEVPEEEAALEQQVAAVVGQAAEFVPLDVETDQDASLEEDISLEGVVWKADSGQLLPGKTGGTSGTRTSNSAETDATELGEDADTDPQLSAPLPPPQDDAMLESRSSLDLLSSHERLDPDLVVEEVPTQFVERLQQAVGAGHAPGLADDVADVVMPQVIRGLAALVRNGTAEMRLQLQPPDMGEIELRVRTTEATVRGEMMVQRPEIKQLLDGHMDRLRNALAGQGLELEGFDVNVGRDAHFAQDSGSWQREGGGRPGSLAQGRRTVEPQAVEAVPAGVGRSDSAVDYTI